MIMTNIINYIAKYIVWRYSSVVKHLTADKDTFFNYMDLKHLEPRTQFRNGFHIFKLCWSIININKLQNLTPGLQVSLYHLSDAHPTTFLNRWANYNFLTKENSIFSSKHLILFSLFYNKYTVFWKCNTAMAFNTMKYGKPFFLVKRISNVW